MWTSLSLMLVLAGAADLDAEVKRVTPDAVEAYKWFHAHPELSGQEVETAKRLAEELRKLGLEVHEGIGGTGVVGILANGKGPVVLYRADMDGLPVTEKTGVPYASENPGVMHACGHDLHMATAVGALAALAATKDRWKGTVLFVGQPAEETGRGAKAMLGDKAFRKLLARVGKPRLVVALHDTADLPAGQVSIIGGFHHANVDSVDIVVHGKGGHGARPHETIDPVVIGADIVMTLQTIVSRRIPPQEKAVVTVGKFAAGTKHNIIPPDATLLLTVRSYSDETRATLLAEIKRIAIETAKAHRAPRAPDITMSDGLPAAFNDEPWTGKVRARFVDALGQDNVRTHEPSMGGEDFGLFGRNLEIPAVMWQLGGVDPKRWKATGGKGLPGLHSDLWAPAPKPALATGIRTVVESILAGLAS
jgi:hippurate hydrolase